MTLKEMELKRREKGYTFQQIAELSGLSEEVVICALGRMELIDGVIYDMTAPMSGHQMTISRIANTIQNYIDKKRGKCLMFVSPIDVQLDCDNQTMVQPDLLVLCERSKLKRRGIMGAPDFIVEISR